MRTKILLLLCFISLLSMAQEIPKLNAGIDFLLFNGEIENSSGTFNYSSKVGFFLEKPFQSNASKRIFFNPGLSFKAINQDYSGGGLGAGSTSELNHYSISGYLKIIYKTDFINKKHTGLYFGVFGGTPFYTWVKGSTSSYSTLYPEANWEKPNYKEHPSQLFEKMYFGLLTGIGFANNAFIKPSLEVRFLPIFGEYKESVLNPFELAINLAFGTKKLKLKE